MSSPKTSIIWFRRDLRINDHPALLAAIESSDQVIPLFILDKQQIKEAGSKLLAYMGQSLRALDESLGNKLHIIEGDQVEVLSTLIKKYGVEQVHISAEYERYGAARDARVEAAGITLVRTGSPYAVAPGRVLKPSDATPYKVYTPFYKGWRTHGYRAPAITPKKFNCVEPTSEYRAFPDFPMPDGVNVIQAGEAAALKRFKEFTNKGLDSYDENRNFAGIDGTSKMGSYLKFGEIHPRTLLAGLGESKAHDTFRKEIAWREFYADVLFNNPMTDVEYYAPKFAQMRYDKPGAQFKAWCEGKTGYPFVDAAMRQLVLEGWMHNRTRMVVASFLVKDLHLEWQLGMHHRITECLTRSNKVDVLMKTVITFASMFQSLHTFLHQRFTNLGYSSMAIARIIQSVLLITRSNVMRHWRDYKRSKLTNPQCLALSRIHRIICS